MAIAFFQTRRRRFAGAAFVIAALAGSYGILIPSASNAAEDAALLAGKITAADGAPLAGIPVKAHKAGGTITVSVYTDKSGEYSFPSWSDVKPGSYEVKVELPDFEHVSKTGVGLAQGKAAQVDFALKSKPVAYEDATASEIIAALPGTDREKVLFAQCSNCHSLQWALGIPRPREDWVGVVKKMAGKAGERDAPSTYDFSQKRFIEPLADYLTSIRGPKSKRPSFIPRPRPTDAASTNMVVTEYDLPRGGQRDVYMFRGNSHFVWPHDVIKNKDYAYYADHFSYVLGRVNLKTGEGTEMPYTIPPGAGRDMAHSDGRPGNPAGGAQELHFDSNGDIVIGIQRGTIKYQTRTGKFTGWASGEPLFGMDPQNNVWHLSENGVLAKLDTSSGVMKRSLFPIPKNSGTYDIDTDAKSRTNLYIWTEDKIGFFDPATAEYSEHKAPTPQAGPRRGEIDAQNRLWAAEFFAGQVLMFDPDKKQMKEFPVIDGGKPFTAPYAEPYAASADSKNQMVWTNDFSSSRIFRIDMNTGKSTEYMTPSNYEIRYFKVEQGAPRPTVWIPAYRPPSKIVKIELR